MSKKESILNEILTSDHLMKWDVVYPLIEKYDIEGLHFLIDLLNEPNAICKLNALEDLIKNCDIKQCHNINNLYAPAETKKPSRFKTWLNNTSIGKQYIQFESWFNRTFGWFFKNGNK